MYRIIVVSDTHRHIEYAVSLIERIREFDAIVHLGDNICDANEISKCFPGKTVVSIQGNNDYAFANTKQEYFSEVEGVKLFAVHGHGHGVKYGYERIYYAALEKGADVVMFGHTHIPVCEKMRSEKSEILLVNPGGYNSMQRGVAIIEIENGKANACLYPYL